jgi:single-strand DNA-binding protein
MAEDINHVVLVGRLTRDAEIMVTNSGYPLAKISLAVNRRRKSGDQWIDEGNFFDINLWGKRGEALAPYLKKGQQIAVDGQLRQDRWEQDGMKRSKVVIEAQNIQLLGSRPGEARPQGGPAPARGNTSSEPARQNYPPADDHFEDDIPF